MYKAIIVFPMRILINAKRVASFEATLSIFILKTFYSFKTLTTDL